MILVFVGGVVFCRSRGRGVDILNMRCPRYRIHTKSVSFHNQRNDCKDCKDCKSVHVVRGIPSSCDVDKLDSVTSLAVQTDYSQAVSSPPDYSTSTPLPNDPPTKKTLAQELPGTTYIPFNLRNIIHENFSKPITRSATLPLLALRGNFLARCPPPIFHLWQTDRPFRCRSHLYMYVTGFHGFAVPWVCF